MNSDFVFSKMLSQEDVAVLLRCTVEHVQRLRLKRKLTYIRGRPVRIAEDDVVAYVARAKVRRVSSAAKSGSHEYVSVGGQPRPFKLLTSDEAAERFAIPVKRVRYLCLSGQIPYIVGRPRIVDEYDLVEYFAEKKKAKSVKPLGSAEYAEVTGGELIQKIKHRIRVKALQRKITKLVQGRTF